MVADNFRNPFRPGAGHPPPYLAGREAERQVFLALLRQRPVVDNLILTGLRGVGKTVLLDSFKPEALESGWLWVANDLSEAASLTDSAVCTRVLADLAVGVSGVAVAQRAATSRGFISAPAAEYDEISYEALQGVFARTPGLAADKLKAVLEFVWDRVGECGFKGIVFAYDEAQNLGIDAVAGEHPVELLLDAFYSVQRKGIPLLLALAGLPTLLPRLVEARTYAERMFKPVSLGRLNRDDSAAAMREPVRISNAPVEFSDASVDVIYKASQGYPYFIQYICREAFDVWAINPKVAVPLDDIVRKLDSDFFAGRWARTTDRQRDLLRVIAGLEHAAAEFSVQDIVAASRATERPFSPSRVGQMLLKLSEAGLVYRNRYSRYSLAVPLLEEFIRRETAVC